MNVPPHILAHLLRAVGEETPGCRVGCGTEGPPEWDIGEIYCYWPPGRGFNRWVRALGADAMHTLEKSGVVALWHINDSDAPASGARYRMHYSSGEGEHQWNFQPNTQELLLKYPRVMLRVLKHYATLLS